MDDAVGAVMLDINLESQQARQDSNLQPPVLEPTPSNAGVGTNPGTEEEAPAHPLLEHCLAALAQVVCPAGAIPGRRARGFRQQPLQRMGTKGDGGIEIGREACRLARSIASPGGGDYAV